MILLSDVSSRRAVSARSRNGTLVVFAQPQLTSALDSDSIADGKRIAATSAFSASVGSRDLSFKAVQGSVVDEQTGSQWTSEGRALRGPLKGTQLRRVNHIDTFWFAWAAFQPDVSIARP